MNEQWRVLHLEPPLQNGCLGESSALAMAGWNPGITAVISSLESDTQIYALHAFSRGSRQWEGGREGGKGGV